MSPRCDYPARVVRKDWSDDFDCAEGLNSRPGKAADRFSRICSSQAARERNMNRLADRLVGFAEERGR